MIPAWVQGEASGAGRQLARRLVDACRDMHRPFCIIAGGETTVSVGSGGAGGRNQEMALAAVDPLAGLAHVFFITMATDGNDGPTDAAGAVATGETRQRAAQDGMSAHTYLAQHDSYHFFDTLGDLLRIGYTGTN
ncbi:MAG: MOFRL family protein, partial [Anaerolineales bacterium]